MNESERWIRVAQELSGRVGDVLGDAIPPDARNHLLNAQRELLTALVLIYEHQAGARRAAPPEPRSRPRQRRPLAEEDDLDGADVPRARVRKIRID